MISTCSITSADKRSEVEIHAVRISGSGSNILMKRDDSFHQHRPAKHRDIRLMMWRRSCPFFVMNADFADAIFPLNPQVVIGVCAIAGIAGAKIYHVLESPSALMAAPFSLIFTGGGFAWFGASLRTVGAYLHSRGGYQIPVLTFLDACSPAATAGYAVGRWLSSIRRWRLRTATSLPWDEFSPPAWFPARCCTKYGLSA